MFTAQRLSFNIICLIKSYGRWFNIEIFFFITKYLVTCFVTIHALDGTMGSNKIFDLFRKQQNVQQVFVNILCDNNVRAATERFLWPTSSFCKQNYFNYKIHSKKSQIFVLLWVPSGHGPQSLPKQ